MTKKKVTHTNSKRKTRIMTQRISWDEYFLKIADTVAERSTCLRRKVGAVLVSEKRILATGYNGAPRNLTHCSEIGCLRKQLNIKPAERIEICRGIHAEQNALVQAAYFGLPVAGATVYSTHFPCITCAKMLINAGIKRIVVRKLYPDELAQKMLSEAKVLVEIVK
ncbi:MAG: cytidine/deoxycytidylate deaminase family protein [candidate division WOR-3 bacterium]|nr:cytidine/deoxycytidylate deaminase family protein [candidate division WOR-3 bacterium]